MGTISAAISRLQLGTTRSSIGLGGRLSATDPLFCIELGKAKSLRGSVFAIFQVLESDLGSPSGERTGIQELENGFKALAGSETVRIFVPRVVDARGGEIVDVFHLRSGDGTHPISILP